MKLILRMILAACLIGCGSRSGPGDEGPNGGDVRAQEIAPLIQDVVSRLQAMPEVFPEVDQKQLAAAVSRVRIFFRDRTYADGSETDATNNGYDEIRINRARWSRIAVYENKLSLLLHELLGLISVEDSGQYMVSSRILTETRFNSGRRYVCEGWNVEMQTNIKCRMRLRFELAWHSFRVTDVDCEHGGISGWGREGDIYSWVNGEYYSTQESCDYPSSPGERTECSGSDSSSEPESYERLIFESGYKFHFEMYTRDGGLRTVSCKGI